MALAYLSVFLRSRDETRDYEFYVPASAVRATAADLAAHVDTGSTLYIMSNPRLDYAVKFVVSHVVPEATSGEPIVQGSIVSIEYDDMVEPRLVMTRLATLQRLATEGAVYWEPRGDGARSRPPEISADRAAFLQTLGRVVDAPRVRIIENGAPAGFIVVQDIPGAALDARADAVPLDKLDFEIFKAAVRIHRAQQPQQTAHSRPPWRPYKSGQVFYKGKALGPAVPDDFEVMTLREVLSSGNLSLHVTTS